MKPDSNLEIMNPVESVELSNGQTIKVTELPWPKAIDFTKKISKHLAELLKKEGDEGKQTVQITTENLVAHLETLVNNITDLASWLISESTELSPEETAKLRTVDAFVIIETAIELNFNSAFMKRGKSLADKIRNIFGQATN